MRREESRGFDVFFGCFVCVFGIWKREKCVEKSGREQIFRKKCLSPLVCGVLEAIYSPGMRFEVAALGGPPASKGLKRGLILAPLGNILTSYFKKGMNLENPMVGSNVMAIKS